MSQQWYCRIGENEFGPLSAAELRAMASSGRLSARDLVRSSQENPWSPAGRVRGLQFTAAEMPQTLPNHDRQCRPAQLAVLIAKPSFHRRRCCAFTAASIGEQARSSPSIRRLRVLRRWLNWNNPRWRNGREASSGLRPYVSLAWPLALARRRCLSHE